MSTGDSGGTAEGQRMSRDELTAEHSEQEVAVYFIVVGQSYSMQIFPHLLQIIGFGGFFICLLRRRRRDLSHSLKIFLRIFSHTGFLLERGFTRGKD